MESTEWIDSWLRSFCGNSSGLLLALLLLVLLDYITGICVAIQTKQLSSQIGAKGITKKVAMFVVIAFCHVLDAYLLHAEAALETVSTIFYLSNEGISILENVGKLGVPLPQKVQTLLTYLTQNDCYRSGGALTPQGLMLHSVGCAQPDAMAFVQSWNQPGVKACVHGFIDANTGAVYQTLPWTCRGWHGGGSSNNTHIGVEMCEPASIRYTSGANFLDQDPAATEAAVLRTYGTAVDLFAQLCRTFSLDPLGNGVILSHREGHQRGIATNHGDPEHLWSPFGLTMDIFRQAVSAALTGPAAAPASPAVPFLGRVTADALHIRSGPGTNCPIVGTIRDQGVYTIVETADGQGASQWGKLKSGAGWIALDYVTPQ